MQGFALLRPATATLVIFNRIWNDFLLSYLFLSFNDKATLVMQIYNGIFQWWTDWPIMMPVLVLVVTPMIVFYIFMQRQIVAGLTAGSSRA